MKKYLLTVLIIIFAGCYDNSLEIESYADYTDSLSYKVGSKRDTRLTFFDINELKQIRSIPNNLTEGDLLGRVQFAQTHTIDPKNNAARNEPSLIPYRNALLLFTPQMELSSLKATVTATYNGVKSTQTYTLEQPKNMPKSDKNNSDKKDITYSKRSFSVMLPFNMVTPDMRIDFEGTTANGSILQGSIYNNMDDIYVRPNIEFAAPQEGVFLFLKLGMLVGVPTDPVYQFDMIDDAAHAMAEYFQTVPFARLVNGKYEDVVLNEVILSDGKIYTGQSDYQNPDAYSGDMREDVAKAQFSVGIDLANKGVASSPLNQEHELKNDMFYFTVHHTQGKYAGGKVQGHGLSGGNGIGTLYASRGNEFSHEVGHGYNMGHYPFSDTVSYGSIHGYQTGWGYDAYHNRMRANVAWNSGGGTEEFMQYFITPFQATYNWNKDSMAGGWVDSAISRYTHNTAMTTRQIQQNLKVRYFLSDSKDMNGLYEYLEWDEANRKIRSASTVGFNRISPSEKGVPVITILGGYNPDTPTQSVIYPRLRGNWGNIFGSLFTANPEGSVYLEITYSDNSKEYVKLNETRFNSGIINKFHVNIPESKKPVQVVLNNKGVKETITIDVNDYNTPMPKAVIIGKENGYKDVIAVDVARLNELLKDKVVASYTLSEKEKYLITTLDFNNSIGMLDANQKAIANDYLNITKSIKLIDDFIEQNYELLENDNQEKDTELKNFLNSKGMGSVSYLFNQAVINGKCIAVNSDKAVTAETCNELENQRWVIDSTGRIHSAVYPGYCLELGKMQTLQLCSESLYQRWKIKTDTGKIQYENIGKANNCIDNSASEPKKIIAYQCNNGANQQFKEEISTDDNKYLSVMQGSLIEDIWKYIPATAGVE